MNRRVRTFAVVLASMIPSIALAQQPVGPPAGTWGAEAATNSSASLLRFRSANSAWLFGVSAALNHVTEEESNPVTGGTTSTTESQFSTQFRVGIRQYGQARERVRPFSTISAIGGISDFGIGDGWNIGASGELGAAYFFSQHVSLGVSGELALRYDKIEISSGAFGQERRSLNLSFSGFRLLGAVYF